MQSVHAMVDGVLEGLEWLGLTFRAFISHENFPEAEKVFTLEYTRLGANLKELEIALRTGKLDIACDIFEQQVTPFLKKLLPLTEEILQK